MIIYPATQNHLFINPENIWRIRINTIHKLAVIIQRISNTNKIIELTLFRQKLFVLKMLVSQRSKPQVLVARPSQWGIILSKYFVPRRMLSSVWQKGTILLRKYDFMVKVKPCVLLVDHSKLDTHFDKGYLHITSTCMLWPWRNEWKNEVFCNQPQLYPKIIL